MRGAVLIFVLRTARTLDQFALQLQTAQSYDRVNRRGQEDVFFCLWFPLPFIRGHFVPHFDHVLEREHVDSVDATCDETFGQIQRLTALNCFEHGEVAIQQTRDGREDETVLATVSGIRRLARLVQVYREERVQNLAQLLFSGERLLLGPSRLLVLSLGGRCQEHPFKLLPQLVRLVGDVFFDQLTNSGVQFGQLLADETRRPAGLLRFLQLDVVLPDGQLG